jgi:hypothetical protein
MGERSERGILRSRNGSLEISIVNYLIKLKEIQRERKRER